MRRTRRRIRPKRHRRSKTKATTLADVQKPTTKDDSTRLGRHAVRKAHGQNLKQMAKRMISAKDGTIYYRGPNGWIRTNGHVAENPDGTLRVLPPDARPSKRERAKMKRQLKRERAG